MKPIFKVVLFFFVASFFTSCEQELIVEEDTTVANATLAADASIRRTKLKKRNNGTFKSVLTVEDPLGAVSTAEIEMLPTNNIQPTPAFFVPDLISENESTKKFRFNQLNFENGEANGWPFKKTVTLKDIEGQAIGSPIENWTTAQDNDEVELLDISLKQYGPTGDYKVKTKFRALDSSFVESVTIYFNKVTDDGFFEKDRSVSYFTSNRRGGRGQDDIYSFKWDLNYDEADAILNLINEETGEVGIVVEVKSTSGVIIDDDFFVVQLENTEPEGVVVKNTSHKIQPNGNHRLRLRLVGSQSTEAERVIISIPGGNADGSDREVEMNSTASENPVFVAQEGTMNNIISGLTYSAPTTVLNSAGEIILEDLVEFTVTQSNNQTTFESIFDELAADETDSFTLNMNVDPIRVPVTWHILQATVTPQDGGSETELETMQLSLVTEENTRFVFKGEIPFIEPDNVIDMEYLVRYTFLDIEGNELASLERDLVAKETPASTFVTCMSNGAEGNLFEFSVTTNESSYKNTDVIYVNFGKESGDKLTPDCSYSLFRDASNGDEVTFKGESLRFLDLREVDDKSLISFSLTPTGEEVRKIRFIDAETIQNLGFFDESTGEWRCEDQCLAASNQCNEDRVSDLSDGVLTVHVCHL